MTWVNEQLDRLYDGGVYLVHMEDVKNEEKNFRGKARVYGEITREGLEEMISSLGRELTEEDVFYDLGSGHGRAVYHVLLTTPIKSAKGIELSALRHKKALEIGNGIELPENKNAELINGDILEENFDDATVIWFDNIMYTDEDMLGVWEKIPNGCLLVTNAQIPSEEVNNNHLQKNGQLAYNWKEDGAKGQAFYYVK